MAPACSAHDDDGALGLFKALLQLGDGVGAGVDFRHRVGPGIGHLDHVGQHVLGQRHHHRAGAARGGDVERARDDFGDARGVVDLHRPFGHGAEHSAVVQFLERLAPHHAARHLAHEDDERCRILVRNVDARRGIGGSRATRDKADARPTGELALRLGHHGRAAFLAADGDVHLGVVQRVQRGQIAFAGHAEQLPDTVQHKLIDEHLSAGARGEGMRGLGVCLHGVLFV
ncbi:hypothetical protein SDC9_166033 [bioreactor metagenome]|uniref:Uncharacterized protein n=1 Tax=bioreactor metagenome TaxID=1076179 RepID=A0A645FYG1_9ZZZZ